MDIIDLLKVAQASKAEAEEREAKINAIAPKFETEAEALAHAERLARLQPGDRVRIPNADNDSLIEGIVFQKYKEATLEVLTFRPTNGRIGTQRLSVSLIRLP